MRPRALGGMEGTLAERRGEHREWNTTPDFVNHSQAGNVFMLGAGGVIGTSTVSRASP